MNLELEFAAMDSMKNTAYKIYYEQNVELDQHLEVKKEGARYEKNVEIQKEYGLCLYGRVPDMV